MAAIGVTENVPKSRNHSPRLWAEMGPRYWLEIVPRFSGDHGEIPVNPSPPLSTIFPGPNHGDGYRNLGTFLATPIAGRK